ncbi:non-homologous end-joining DNA ligase [Crossiella sp. SN42]|uniref:non-homologous end-joining DNA ligase n=1 Tax=Crossiella sp. SN42 TaxID=2944808 RepID=UPI00207C5720|nr:non-homologous end-joining DNA ligase [Crossiella sp. SN42]MCO1574222.1 non-homologous end-joining DNA ligase [Crossiella sp. SN42]
MASARRGRGGLPEAIEPMLASPDGGKLVDDPRFAYEFKWDGYRAVMRVAGDGETALTSRNGKDFTAEFPELTTVLGPVLAGRPAVLDGEIVALNQRGHPDFSLLQNRRTGRLRGIDVRYFAFDLLQLGATRLLDEPYVRRRELLGELTPPEGSRLSITPYYRRADLTERGMTPAELLGVAAASHLEGLVAKAIDSRYTPGARSRAWLKHPLIQTLEVVIGGWQAGQGRREGTLGALLLGAHDPAGNLVYLGNVGTGFTDLALDDLHRRLRPLAQPGSPFAEVPRDRARRAHWVRPELVGEVVYRQFTPGEGRLRHTAWRGLRPERRPEEVLLPAGLRPEGEVRG